MELDFKMKLIDSNIDKNINKKYDLFKIKIQDIRELLGSKYKKINMKDFNEGDDKIKGEYEFDFQKIDHEECDIADNIKFNAGIENNFITIHKIKNEYFLVDGFRRLFFDLQTLNRDIDREVYVKIFNEDTSEEDIMKLLCYANLWKYPQGIEVFLDRGWRLYLSFKLRIRLSNESTYDSKKYYVNHFEALEKYIDGKRYSRNSKYSDVISILSSPRFYDDLKLIDEIIRKKSTPDINHCKDFIKEFCNILGENREESFTKKISKEIYYKFLENESIEVTKIQNMGVRGFYFPRISSLTSKFFGLLKEDREEEIMNIDPSKIKGKLMTLQEYYKIIPIEFRKKYSPDEPIGVGLLTFSKKNLEYRNKKLYFKYCEMPPTRIHLFFGDYFVWYSNFNHNYYISEINRLCKIDLHYNTKTSFIFGGDLEGVQLKVKEMTGKHWKKNARETEFWENIK